MDTNIDSKWWETFIERTDNFKKTAVIKNVMSKDLIEKLNLAVMDGLRNRILAEDKNGLRIYFPEKDKRKEFDEFIDTFFKSPPKTNEDIKTYSNRIFKEKFGMIINFYERHSNYISNEIREVIDPLFKNIGIPATGIDITVFIGNYGWTPLGIHQDHIGENVMHFHLGPAPKTMYTWDEDEYKKLTNTKHNNFEIKPLLKYAEKYDFSAGDVYFMPWNKFHIGKTDELSVGVTLWFNNPTKVRYFDKIMNTFYTSYVDDNNDVLLPFDDYLNSEKPFETFLSIIKNKEKNNFLNLTVKDFFSFLFEEYRLSLISNGGWQATPLSQKDLKKYNMDEYHFLEEAKVVSNPHFNILYNIDKQNNTISAFVRGSKISIKHDKEIIRIIEQLNTHQVISVQEMLAKSNGNWPKEASLYFLSMVYDKRGFELVE